MLRLKACYFRVRYTTDHMKSEPSEISAQNPSKENPKKARFPEIVYHSSSFTLGLFAGLLVMTPIDIAAYLILFQNK